MKLEDILLEWESDSKINKMDLGDTSIQTSFLHSKYLNFWVESKAQHKKSEQDLAKLLKDKWLYYEGKMDEETIKTLGWDPDPYNGCKIMKGDRKHWYESDDDLQKADLKVTHYKTKIETLANIIDVLKWRHQTIKNIIDFRRFENGG